MTGQECVLLVLGAGLSRRFGQDDKLEAVIGQRKLAHHLLGTVGNFNWQQKRVVHRASGNWHEAYDEAGFQSLINNAPERGLGASLALGITGLPPETRVLVCLADMPFISTDLVGTLRAASDAAPDQIFASHSPDYRGPPAVFPVSDLRTLDPDSENGARPLLRRARLIAATPDEIRDIDFREDAQEADHRMRQAEMASLARATGPAKTTREPSSQEKRHRQ
ncbi:nucleotidyltransferase family protein [Asaia spathodeae]|uniref:NTP transferase domain-containing protein n=1 Tax=Asaia spathodeae TaxID=657016 RepID=A0ABX2P398_9PROT|nr:NTP transferase domain-containing protein [Asaia spathodeae]GBR17144.1 putative MobA-related protein [Asaia spathodeae NBRC 105894]